MVETLEDTGGNLARSKRPKRGTLRQLVATLDRLMKLDEATGIAATLPGRPRDEYFVMIFRDALLALADAFVALNPVEWSVFQVRHAHEWGQSVLSGILERWADDFAKVKSVTRSESTRGFWIAGDELSALEAVRGLLATARPERQPDGRSSSEVAATLNSRRRIPDPETLARWKWFHEQVKVGCDPSEVGRVAESRFGQRYTDRGVLNGARKYGVITADPIMPRTAGRRRKSKPNS